MGPLPKNLRPQASEVPRVVGWLVGWLAGSLARWLAEVWMFGGILILGCLDVWRFWDVGMFGDVCLFIFCFPLDVWKYRTI